MLIDTGTPNRKEECRSWTDSSLSFLVTQLQGRVRQGHASLRRSKRELGLQPDCDLLPEPKRLRKGSKILGKDGVGRRTRGV